MFYLRYAASELRRRRGRAVCTVLALALGAALATSGAVPALALVVLAGTFLIAGLLALSSVAERRLELATLKALGWPQWHVTRQVAGESLAQGLLGGVIVAVLGPQAVALAVAGGLIAGAAGGIGAARLRPEEAA